MAHPAQCPHFTSATEFHYSRGGIRVNRRRDLILKVFVRPDATPFSVRVYVTSWTLAGHAPDDYQKAEYTFGWSG
jgi:hypothetical protein